MASSSPQRYVLARDGEAPSPDSVAHKTAQSSPLRRSNGICSPNSNPMTNALTHVEDETDAVNTRVDRSSPRSYPRSTREDTGSFQRVQPGGPFFSVSNSLYEFPATAALEPGSRREVLEETPHEITTQTNNVEGEQEQQVVSPVSEAEELDEAQSSQEEEEEEEEEEEDDDDDETDRPNKSLEQILRTILSNTSANNARTSEALGSSVDAPALPTSVVLQALQQALAMTGQSGNMPTATTQMLSEVLAKPVKNAKDARARRGAIIRYKRAAEATPSAPSQSGDNGGQGAGSKRKLSEEEMEEKRIKNRASVQACRHRKRVRKNELEAEQGHYEAENRALRGIVWSIDVEDSDVLLSPETRQLRNEAKAELNPRKYPDE